MVATSLTTDVQRHFFHSERNFGQRFAYGQTPGGTYCVCYPMSTVSEPNKSRVKKKFRAEVCLRADAQWYISRVRYPVSTVCEPTTTTTTTTKGEVKRNFGQRFAYGQTPQLVFVPATQCRRSMSRTHSQVKRGEKKGENFGQRFAYGPTPSSFCSSGMCVSTSSLVSAKPGGIRSLLSHGRPRKEEKRKEK